jgi:stage II sporulation protein AA (anti-sigma F factor antagonist)
MAVEINVTGEVVTAYLSGELDHHTAKEMREAIDTAIELNMPTLLILDFKDVTFMDSSGIGLVMGRYRNLQKTGAEFHITGTPPNIYKVFRLAGIEKLAKLESR